MCVCVCVCVCVQFVFICFIYKHLQSACVCVFLLSFKGPQSTCRCVSGIKNQELGVCVCAPHVWMVYFSSSSFFSSFFAGGGGGGFNLPCAIPDAAKNNFAIYPHNLLVSLGCQFSLPPYMYCQCVLDLGGVCTTSFMSIHYVLWLCMTSECMDRRGYLWIRMKWLKHEKKRKKYAGCLLRSPSWTLLSPPRRI